MSEDTKLTELIINTLSPEQMPEVLSDTEIYLVEDDAEYATVEELATKQDELVSGTNIKTLNNESILGSGNLDIDGLPSQEGNEGKFLTTNGITPSWDDVSSIEPLSQEEYDRRKEAGELEEGKYYSTPSDVSLQILQTLYPVGSLYITTNNTCPLQSLGIGTWILEASDRVLQGAGSRGAVGTTINESLPNITGMVQSVWIAKASPSMSGALKYDEVKTPSYGKMNVEGANKYSDISIDASLSSSTYQDNAPVQQNAYLINVYRRIS